MAARSYHVPVDVNLPPSVPLYVSLSARACGYLVSRGFDPQELCVRWSVAYCQYSPNSTPRIDDRLVIPIHAPRTNIFGLHHEIILAGWQAREIHHSSSSGCKYLSMQGMRKSNLLYGLPQAMSTSGPLVVVEGPSDVWRLGSNAVALFGKSISVPQVALLVSHFAGRPIVVVLDHDAQREAQSAVTAIRQSRTNWRDSAPVILGFPPEGAKDFGETTRDAAWAAVWKSLSQRV